MSLIAYAFGGALEGAGKGLAKVGEHRRRMEGERLREEFWKEQNQLKMQQQRDLDGEDKRHRETQTKERMTHSAALTSLTLGTQADWRKEDIAQRKEEGKKNRGLRQQEIDLRGKELKARRDETAARRKAQTTQAAAKQAAEKEKGGAARRQDALDLAIKTSKITDDNNNEVIDWNAVGYKMKFWENNDERLPLSRAVTWNDIKVTAEAEGISLEEARDRYRNLGHPVPLGDPPPRLANPGGEHAGAPILASPPPKELWPGRRRYSPR